jgi:hypothetical protein
MVYPENPERSPNFQLCTPLDLRFLGDPSTWTWVDVQCCCFAWLVDVLGCGSVDWLPWLPFFDGNLLKMSREMLVKSRNSDSLTSSTSRSLFFFYSRHLRCCLSSATNGIARARQLMLTSSDSWQIMWDPIETNRTTVNGHMSSLYRGNKYVDIV